jgi:hypothetical protein
MVFENQVADHLRYTDVISGRDHVQRGDSVHQSLHPPTVSPHLPTTVDEAGADIARIIHRSVQRCTGFCGYFPVYPCRLFVGSEPKTTLHRLSAAYQGLRCHKHPHRRGDIGSSDAIPVEVESVFV